MINPKFFETELREDPNIKEIRSFVLRSKALNKTQEEILEKYYDEFSITFDKNPKKFFLNDNPIIIEIGFGSGQITYNLAKENPNINYIGIEVYQDGYIKLLKKIAEDNLKNIKLIRFDANSILDYMIKDNSLRAFYIFFPDPWQKKKHFKRRLIKKDFLLKLYEKLEEDGYIYIVTDWDDYAIWIEDEIKKAKVFKREDKVIKIEKGTFEKKAIEKNHTIHTFYLKK